jgi:predicted Zn-dependent peptidase
MKKSTGAVWLAVTLCVLLAHGFSAAQDLATFEENVTVETLDNGLTVVIYERPTAPVVSFFTHVDVGSAQEVPGITGLAHMFEHMAFKGTSVIGTKNYKKEAKAIEAVDQAYAALAAEETRPGGGDAEKIEELKAKLKEAQDAADEYLVANEFGEIIDRAGGVGLNAFTNTDTTGYMFSLPANKVELWAYLESERFLDPVFRQFYLERDVVQEERRMRTDSNPIGRMIEQFQAVAFEAHPYRQPVVGYMSDLKRFTREDAEAFYSRYYVPANMTVAIVGDVQAKQLLPIVRKYFERLPAGEEPPPLRTIEPPSKTEKIVVMPDPSQPVYVEGYHRPAAAHPDDAVYDAIADILSTGRDSRLYRSLVRDKQIALVAGAFNGYPGTKYPHLMLFFGLTSPGHENEEVQAAIRDEIERITSEPVSADELTKVKVRAKANLIRGLTSNSGIAMQLATNQARYGDWRELFRSVEKIDQVTQEDILRVAQATFVPTNRIVGMIVNEESEEN